MVTSRRACRRTVRPARRRACDVGRESRDSVPATRCERSLQCVGPPALRRVTAIHGLDRRPGIPAGAAIAVRSCLALPLAIRSAAAGSGRPSVAGYGIIHSLASAHTAISNRSPGSAGLSPPHWLSILPRVRTRTSLGRESTAKPRQRRPSAPPLETRYIPDICLYMLSAIAVIYRTKSRRSPGDRKVYPLGKMGRVCRSAASGGNARGQAARVMPRVERGPLAVRVSPPPTPRRVYQRANRPGIARTVSGTVRQIRRHEVGPETYGPPAPRFRSSVVTLPDP